MVGPDVEAEFPEKLATPVRPHRGRGVNAVGFFRAEFGHGEAARRILAGLDHAGIPFSTTTVKTPHHRERHEFADREADAPYPTNLVCLNPEHLLEQARRSGGDFLGDRYTIGAWCWEVRPFPSSLHPAFDLVDEVWAPSDFSAELFAAETEKPVRTFPMPVLVPPPPDVSRTKLGLPPDRFVFLFAYDFFSTLERKNPLGLIEAFNRAFSPGSGPVLVLKSINGSKKRQDLELVRAAARGNPDIRVVDGYVSGEEMRGLVAASDCFVSLHRSEGFGLSLAEAMVYGRPVIATRYSGNLTFMNDENSYLVDCGLTTVPSTSDTYPPGAVWADPDLDAAAEAMRSVHGDQDEARARAERGRETILADHSLDRMGDFLVRRLDEVAGLKTTRRIEQSAAHRARRFLAEGPSLRWDLPSPRFGRLGPPARRFLRRALRPYLVRQGEWEALVVDALLHSEAADAERARELARLTELADGLRERVDELEGQLYARPYSADAEPEGESQYSSFEAVFRGSEDRVLDLLRPYVPLAREHAPVLDLGCGRGEFLDLLREEGIEATGVDSDPGMVARAREKGHTVELADGSDYLGGLPDGALGLVFAAHVVEHLPYEQLLRLLELSRDKLRAEGLLVAETINPHSIAAFKTFWTDPTHRAPIFPEVLATLASIQGFDPARITFPRGSGDAERDLRYENEYALVATKSSREAS